MRLKECFDKGLLRKLDLPEGAPMEELANSRRHLDNARKCAKSGMPDLAVVSAYTSMFHSARALLFRDKIKERSHVCVVAYIQETYPDLAGHARTLDAYRMERHVMLYGLRPSAKEDDALKGIEAAEQFIKAVERELGKST